MCIQTAIYERTKEMDEDESNVGKKRRQCGQILHWKAAEYYTGGRRSSDGIHIEEFYDKDNDILVTKVQVTNEAGQQRLHKPKGTYITLETPHLGEPDEDYQQGKSPAC